MPTGNKTLKVGIEIVIEKFNLSRTEFINWIAKSKYLKKKSMPRFNTILTDTAAFDI